jgi:hypothetical protein
MTVRILLIISAFILIRCDDNRKELLIGTWKTDSVYSYYNGFSLTKHDFEEEPTRRYLANGDLIMTRGSETRNFLYEIKNSDSLIHARTDRQPIEKFVILKVDHNQLVLRKDLIPVFEGKNQERYQIRYLSRIH